MGGRQKSKPEGLQATGRQKLNRWTAGRLASAGLEWPSIILAMLEFGKIVGPFLGGPCIRDHFLLGPYSVTLVLQTHF